MISTFDFTVIMKSLEDPVIWSGCVNLRCIISFVKHSGQILEVRMLNSTCSTNLCDCVAVEKWGLFQLEMLDWTAVSICLNKSLALTNGVGQNCSFRLLSAIYSAAFLPKQTLLQFFIYFSILLLWHIAVVILTFLAWPLTNKGQFTINHCNTGNLLVVQAPSAL